MRFSANLGFLWTDLALPDAIRAAHVAGFAAVELHWPYDTPAAAVRAALDETGLPVLGLNTSRGNVAAGENGLSAVAGREGDARAAIDQALDYAQEIGAGAVHVMAGRVVAPNDSHVAALGAYLNNLEYACDRAAKRGMTILIEPLNPHDAPDYFLKDANQAVDIINDIGRRNLKLMFDCYHVQRSLGDLTHRLRDLLPVIGHIQFASVPDRGTPDHGEVNYAHIFAHIAALGYDAPLGAEYKPAGATVDSLAWLKNLS